MSAGRRNQRITIEQSTPTPDAVGDDSRTWTEYAKAWAEIQTSSGNEFTRAQQVHSEMTHLLKTRWIAGVTTNMRVKRGSVYLNILAVFDPYNRKDTLHILCNEQT